MVTGGATTGGTNHLSGGRHSKELSHAEEAIPPGLGRQKMLDEGNRRCLGRISHGFEELDSTSLIRERP
jgi:hypothetical protein